VVAINFESRSEDSSVKATDIGSGKISFGIQQSFWVDREPHDPHMRNLTVFWRRIISVS
jgi:hypothetical protein